MKTTTTKGMTMTAARAILAPLGITIERKTDRTFGETELRVNFKDGKEATAYYTDDIDDAVGTGKLMSQRGTKKDVSPAQRAALIGAVNKARVDILDARDALKQCMHEVDAALCIAIGVVVRKNADASARLHLARTLTSIIVSADSTIHTLTHQRDAVRFGLDAARRAGDFAVAEALVRVVATFDDCIAMQGNHDEAVRVELAARNAAQAAGVR